jgi:hypothetical protein
MLVLTAASAAQSDSGEQFTSIDRRNEQSPFLSRSGEEYSFFLPSIHSQKEIIDQGDIWNIPDIFASTVVEEGMVHRWRTELYADEVVGITAIAAAPADIVLSVIYNGQPIIDRQNDSPAGEAEVITTADIVADGIYDILIETADRSAAEYAVAPFLPEFEIVFNGLLMPGVPQQDVNQAFEATHFWFFTANAGDLLTMELIPDEQSDIVGDIFAPGAIFYEGVDFGFTGEIERITDLPLAESGLYAILVFDIDFDETGMVYDIVIEW